MVLGFYSHTLCSFSSFKKLRANKTCGLKNITRLNCQLDGAAVTLIPFNCSITHKIRKLALLGTSREPILLKKNISQATQDLGTT